MIFLANLLFYKPLNLSQKACVTYYESFTQLEALKCLGRFFSATDFWYRSTSRGRLFQLCVGFLVKEPVSHCTAHTR